MTVSNKTFSIESIGISYDDSNKLKTLSSKSVFNGINSFDKLKLITSLNSWPVIEFSCKITNWAEFINIKKFKFNIDIYKMTKIEFDATVLKTEMQQDFIKWIGVLGDPELIFHTESQYLGNDWNGACKKLSKRFKLNINHGYTYTSSDGFFMLNETPKRALVRLLSTASNYQYSVGFDSIDLINPLESKICRCLESTTETSELKLLDNIEKVNIIKSKNPFSGYVMANDYEVTDNNYYRTSDKAKIHSNIQNNGVKSFMYNDDYNINMMNNIKFTDGFQIKTLYNINKYLSAKVGEKVKYPSRTSNPYWIISGKELTLSVFGVSTLLLFGNYKSEFSHG